MKRLNVVSPKQVFTKASVFFYIKVMCIVNRCDIFITHSLCTFTTSLPLMVKANRKQFHIGQIAIDSLHHSHIASNIPFKYENYLINDVMLQ